jgi:ABC-type lipoprotein release transport system permease subunit
VTAAWMLGRINMRRRWRAITALTVLIGFAGTVVLAAAAGARRTSTSFDRFQQYSRAADVEVLVNGATEAQLRAFEQSEQVRDVARLRQLTLVVNGDSDLPIAAALDERFGTVVDRPRVVEGRLARLTESDEIVIGELLAERLGVRVGGELTAESYSPQQIEQFQRGENAGPPNGPTVRLHVVGLVRRPLDLAGRGAAGGVLVPTPAFNERYGDKIGSFSGHVLRVRTRNGAADVPTVIERARVLFRDAENLDVQGLAIETEGTRDAIDVLRVAIALFAAIGGVAAAAFIAIICARQVRTVEQDQLTLAGLGMARRFRLLAAASPAVVAALGGAALAAVGAALASSLFPVGVARKADPDLGLRIDSTVLGLGMAAIIIFVTLIASVVAMPATRAARGRRSTAAGSFVARFASRSGLAPAPATGVRFALDPGGGPRSAPVRSALAGAVFGVLGVASVLVFSNSLDHLGATPAAYGWSWDVLLLGNAPVAPAPHSNACGAVETSAADDAAFSTVAAICVYNVEVEGRPISGWSFQPVRGAIDPTIVRGRAPRAPDEIALGGETLRALHKKLGDRVAARGPAASETFVVVGQVVLPSPASFDPQPLADNASFTGAGLNRLLDPDRPFEEFNLIARVSPGTDLSRLARDENGLLVFDVGRGERPTVPVEIDRVQQVERLPTLLGAFLAVLAIVTIAHALLSSVRRRGHEFAVLRVIGLRRGQVRTILASQATTYAVLGVVLGVPLGIVVGQRVWRAVADGLGVSPSAQLSGVAVAIVAIVALVVANLLGAIAAWRALRARPAVALAVE